MIKYLKERANDPNEITRQALIDGVLKPFDGAFVGTLDEAREVYADEELWLYQGEANVFYYNGVRNEYTYSMHCFKRNDDF